MRIHMSNIPQHIRNLYLKPEPNVGKEVREAYLKPAPNVGKPTQAQRNALIKPAPNVRKPAPLPTQNISLPAHAPQPIRRALSPKRPSTPERPFLYPPMGSIRFYNFNKRKMLREPVYTPPPRPLFFRKENRDRIMSAAKPANESNEEEVSTPRANYTAEEAMETMKTPNARSVEKKKLNQTTQYITSTFRKKWNNATQRAIFEIYNDAEGEWVPANASGQRTNDPSKMGVRSEQDFVPLSHASIGNVKAHVLSPAKKGGRRTRTRRVAHRGRKNRRTHHALRSKKSK